jgi:hypothetical protein
MVTSRVYSVNISGGETCFEQKLSRTKLEYTELRTAFFEVWLKWNDGARIDQSV